MRVDAKDRRFPLPAEEIVASRRELTKGAAARKQEDLSGMRLINIIPIIIAARVDRKDFIEN